MSKNAAVSTVLSLFVVIIVAALLVIADKSTTDPIWTVGESETDQENVGTTPKEETREAPPTPASRPLPDGTIGIWWREASGLSGKLRIKEDGSKLTANWTYMNGQTHSQKLVESKQSGLRRFDVSGSGHKDHYIIQEDGWLRLGDSDGVFQVIPPDSIDVPASQPPPRPRIRPRVQHASCDGLEHLDPWNGESLELNRAVKRHLNDPGSLEVLDTKIGPNQSGQHLITMDFTAKNAFGGRVRMRAVGQLNHKTGGVTLEYVR